MRPALLSIPVNLGSAVEASCWQADDAQAVVLIHPATGAAQGYYEPFAHYLASLGFNVVTYDYRGIGRSRPARLRGYRMTMSAWIDEDVGAVTRWAAARYPGLPLLAVGHSVGGHAIGLSADSSRLRAAVLVATHAGITRLIRGRAERARVWLLLRVLTPVLCALLGYMPGRRLGLGEDLPRDVMLQWSRWTSLPRYFLDDPALDAVRRMAAQRLPLLVLGFDDDAWATPAAIDVLTSHLIQAPIERRQYHPRDAGVPAIGHMGFFRKRCEATLWRDVGAWLLALAAHGEGPPAPAQGPSWADSTPAKDHAHASD